MQLLKTLKLTQYQRSNANNPVLQSRIKLAAGITEQIQLAGNPNYKQISVHTVADGSGELREVEVGKRVLRWWCVGADGTVELTVRYGSKPLELAKKNAVELAGEAELVGTLEQIRAAVEQGEFDELIEQQAAWLNRVNTIKAEKPKIEFAD